MTSDELTDDDIEELQVLAERTNDNEYIWLCRLAYRRGGRGISHPLARMRVAAAMTEFRAAQDLYYRQQQQLTRRKG